MGKDLKVKVRLEGDSKGAEKAIKRTESGFKRLAKLAIGGFGIRAGLRLATQAIEELGNAGRRLGQRRALQRALEADGDTIDNFVGKLRSLSNQQIATSDLILASNRALALGIAKDDIPGLLESATKASVSLGISATQAFNDITTGVGRASPLILDNLGIVVDANKIYADYAESIGVATEALTKQQKTLALSRAVIETAGKGAADFADAQSRLTVALDQSRTAFKEYLQDLSNSAAANEGLADVVERSTNGIINFVRGIEALIEAQQLAAAAESAANDERENGIAALDVFTAGLSFATRAVAALGETEKLLADSEREALENIQKLTERRKDQADAIHNVAEATDELAIAQQEAEERTRRIEEEILKEASALDKLAAALGRTTIAELRKEQEELTKALAAARAEMGTSTDGFQRYLELEALANAETEKLERRIESIQLGFGDLSEEVDDASESIDDFGDALDETAASADGAERSVSGLGAAVEETGVATTVLDSALRKQSDALKLTAVEARLTTAEFNALAEAQGRSAAIAAAAANQGNLTLGGTRVRIRSGSRLVNVSGRGGSTFSNYGLSPFGTGGRYTLQPDGTLRPV